MDTNVNTDASINHAIWNAISRRIALGLGTLIQQASDQQRFEYAGVLLLVYNKDTPELHKADIKAKLKFLVGNISIDAFDRLLQNPVAETTQNRMLRAILPTLLQTTKEHLFVPSFNEAVGRTVKRNKPIKSTIVKRSKSDWETIFVETFPELWPAICQEHNLQNPDIPQDAGVVFTWLELEVGKKTNAERKSVENAFSSLMAGDAKPDTLEIYMGAIYAIAKIELPEIYKTLKKIRRAHQEGGIMFARNIPVLWQDLSDRFKETFPDSPLIGAEIYKWVERTLFDKGGATISNIESGLKSIARNGLSDQRNAKLITKLYAIAGKPMPPNTTLRQDPGGPAP